VNGEKLTAYKGSPEWHWTLDGVLWTFDPVENWLYRQGHSAKQRVARMQCLKLAVGFSQGVHEAMGLRQTSELLKVIGL
jgi:hypothetical protein